MGSERKVREERDGAKGWEGFVSGEGGADLSGCLTSTFFRGRLERLSEKSLGKGERRRGGKIIGRREGKEKLKGQREQERKGKAGDKVARTVSGERQVPGKRVVS